MKFKAGDKIDSDLCTSIVLEVMRCNDAFELFLKYSDEMIMKGESRELSYKAYNAYSYFLLHLYEFNLGCLIRDNGDTQIKENNKFRKHEIIEGHITHHANRIMKQNKLMMENGRDFKWVKDPTFFDDVVPLTFAQELRKCRNKIAGHVTYERAQKINLSNFYFKYHKYMYYMYRDAVSWWKNRKEDYPELKEITKFTVVSKRDNEY